MGFDVVELKFALKYPFSELGKRIIAESKISLDSVPERPLKRALNLVLVAVNGEPYDPKILFVKEALVDELLAFPLSKLIVSVVDKFEVKRRYLVFLSNYFFSSLLEAPENELFDLALELKLNFYVESGFFVVSLVDYLRVDHNNVESKLVNQPLVNGFIYFSKHGFARLISDIAVSDVESSLLKPSNVDHKVIEAANVVRDVFSKNFVLVENFNFGLVKVEAFPPCMAKIYSELALGQNAPHMARFSLATFLNAIAMPVEKIVDVFRKTPNFNEKITKYQVERIAGSKHFGKSYSCPNCDKMRSYGLCVANCPVRSPLEFYKLEFKK